MLIGTEKPNFLSGGEGRDKLRGGGGDDILEGASPICDPACDRHGLDDVLGGAGDDEIDVGPRSVAHGGTGDDAVEGYRAEIFGGPGNDSVKSAKGDAVCGAGRDTVDLGISTHWQHRERRVLIARDCERIRPFSDNSLVLRPPRLRDDRILLPVSCTSFATCEGQFNITQGRVLLAKHRFELPLNRPTLLELRLRQPVGRGLVQVKLGKMYGERLPFYYDTRL